MLAASSVTVVTAHRVNSCERRFKDSTTATSVSGLCSNSGNCERSDSRSRAEKGYVWWRRRRHWVMPKRDMIARSMLLKVLITAWGSSVSGWSTGW